MDTQELIQRLADLESRFAFQELALQEQNREIWHLRQDLARMEKTQAQLKARLKELALPEGAMPADQKPPHY